MSERTYFSLIRHGPTQWNRQKRIQGQTRTSLSEHGRERCLGWGACLRAHQDKWGEPGPITRIVSSDLERAVQTTELVNRCLDLPITMDVGFREQDWGGWTGQVIRDLRSAAPEQVREQEERGWEFCPPGGESRLAVLDRVLRALRRTAQRHAGEHVLVVTHKGVLKCLLYRLLGMRFLPVEGEPLGPDKVHTIVVETKLQAVQHGEAKDETESSPNGMRIVALNQGLLNGP